PFRIPHSAPRISGGGPEPGGGPEVGGGAAALGEGVAGEAAVELFLLLLAFGVVGEFGESAIVGGVGGRGGGGEGGGARALGVAGVAVAEGAGREGGVGELGGQREETAAFAFAPGAADQGVAVLEAVVEEGERLAFGERDEPEGELRHLDRHRVLVDAVE